MRPVNAQRITGMMRWFALSMLLLNALEVFARTCLIL